jgi:G:T/U-mismatch repair DNA glycosylase
METHPYIEKQGLTKQLNLSSEEVAQRNFRDGGIWFNDTEVIVCGTFPPRREYLNRKGYIHYSSSRNKFWQHIDAIYNVDLFAPKIISEKSELRISNCLKKIKFLEEKKMGFIDVFTKISRKHPDSSKDDDIIEPYETIFDETIFENILASSIKNIIFVYSKSYNVFVKTLLNKYPNSAISLIREYQKDNITLRVESCIVENKSIYLSYSPIHGKIEDRFRRPALKKAIENEFS